MIHYLKTQYIKKEVKKLECEKEILQKKLDNLDKKIEEIENISDEDFLILKEIKQKQEDSDLEEILSSIGITMDEFDNMDNDILSDEIRNKAKKLSVHNRMKLYSIILNN
jgi:hypothetical protein